MPDAARGRCPGQGARSRAAVRAVRFRGDAVPSYARPASSSIHSLNRLNASLVSRRSGA